MVLKPSDCTTSRERSTSCLYSSSYLVLSCSPKLSTHPCVGCTRRNNEAVQLTHIARRNKGAVQLTHIARRNEGAVQLTHTSRRSKKAVQLTNIGSIRKRVDYVYTCVSVGLPCCCYNYTGHNMLAEYCLQHIVYFFNE